MNNSALLAIQAWNREYYSELIYTNDHKLFQLNQYQSHKLYDFRDINI